MKNSKTQNISYLKILDDFPNPVWRSGKDGKCDFFNKCWLDFTGRKLKQEMGNGWAKGVHKDDFDECLKIYLGNFKKRIPFQMTYRLLHKDKTYHYILDCGAPFYDEEGVFQGYIGSCYDIQSSKDYEQELEKTNSELKKINNIAMDRELKMIELKKEIASLKEKKNKKG